MNRTGLSVAALTVAIVSAAQAQAAFVPSLVNFDPPSQAQAPSTYVAAGAQQTITTAPATFTGGVLLGFATFFPAISFASAPNVYGTADFGVGLSQTLNIAIDPTFATNQVSFALFNGETFAQSYSVSAYDASHALVASQLLTNVAANFNSGYGLVDLQAPNISSVVIAAVGAPTVWDFLIDTVAFNQSIQQGVNSAPPPAIPPPAVFVPPPPVQVVDAEGNEIELELNYGDSIDGRATLNSLRMAPPQGPGPSVPEPATAGLLGLVFTGLAAARRRRVPPSTVDQAI